MDYRHSCKHAVFSSLDKVILVAVQLFYTCVTFQQGLPSKWKMKSSTQPRQRRSGFGTSRWMSLCGPARAWSENNCEATLPIQPERAWQDLQKSIGETPPKQVCQACSVIPKKTKGCNRCRRCFNIIPSKGSEYLCKCNISVLFFISKKF